MKMQYYKEWSGYLGREMEFKVYGEGGMPVLAFPQQGGRFYEWEDRGMAAAVAGLLDTGRVQLFCADSVDGETWAGSGEPRKRLETQEKWYNYITRELYPRVLALNGGKCAGKVLTAGVGRGAGHALNCFLRRPDLFSGVIGLSGTYDGQAAFGEYRDDLLYRNDPLQYLPDLAADDPKLAQCQAGQVILCCGQGYGEEAAQAAQQQLAALLKEKEIPVSAEVWSAEVSHDWYWWQKELSLLLERVLG